MVEAGKKGGKDALARLRKARDEAGKVVLDKGFVRKLPFNYKGTVDFGKIVGEAEHGTL